MSRAFLTLLLLGAAAALSPMPEDSFEFEFSGLERTNLANPGYRLLDVVQPSYYYVDLDVYLDERRFNGEVTINVTVSQSIQQMVLHQKVESIIAVTVWNSEGSQVPLDIYNALELDNYYEVMKINFANNITAGDYVINVVYTGIINENQYDRGFYLGYYYNNGEKRYYATTQFQPYHGRKAIPSFDEPQFKSIFTIAITRDSSLSKSYSNMAIAETIIVSANRTKEIFSPTPIIPVYLIAFHVSDFIETVYGTSDKPVGVISRPGVTAQHSYAGVQAAAITDWLSEYALIDYYNHNPNGSMKNDHIALPDFPSGAMENWGMVNYREAYLLADEANTNLVYRTFIATIIAHEMGHKWFGNLVTCFWWSNLWLNESFASFFEYFAAGGVNPALELEQQFVVDYVHSALLADSATGAVPMNNPNVITTPSITGHFGTSSYAKGASVLKTMEHFVGESTFRKALGYYLADNAYSLGTPEAMYSAFERAVAEDNALSIYAAGVTVTNVFQLYVDTAGAPLIKVDINYSTGEMIVTQERFLNTGNQGAGFWHVPLTYTRGNDIDWTNTKPSVVLTTQSTVITKPAGHEWVIFNKAQSGYYRVDYDDHSWEMIAAGLRNNMNAIHHLSRAQIANDVLNYVRAGRMGAFRAFDVLTFMNQETNYYTWMGFLTPFLYIRNRMMHVPDVLNSLDDYLLRQMNHAIATLGFDELTSDSTSVKLLRPQLMMAACARGHQGCNDYSVQHFQAWKANPTGYWVPPNARPWVYCHGLRNGDYSDYTFLWQQYIQSENAGDMVYMMRAMGCSKDETALREFLQRTMDSDLIRYHDKSNALSYALAYNRDNITVMLDFLFDNYAQIRTSYGGSDRLAAVITLYASYMFKEEDIERFETWLYANQLNLQEEFSTGVAVISSVRSSRVWANNLAPEFRTVLQSAASPLTTSLALVISAAIINIFRG